jgi:poly(hydroxyalkanoate) depolymerase family esterase
MKYELPGGMRAAIRLTKAGRLTEATAVLQHLLGGRSLRGAVPAADVDGPPTIDGVAEPMETPEITRLLHPAPGSGAGDPIPMPKEADGSFKPFRFRMFKDRGGIAPLSPSSTPGGRFLARTFSGHAGMRPYKLYIPTGYRPGEPVPLIVMLHGCTQSPDDFAAGTRMNGVAEAHTCLVAYPGQTITANTQRCWNWFNEKDQRRDGGEPAIIAGITREIMSEYAIDSPRVYVAGLSAGGAAAAIMGDAYPDLYAAIGVHSGLACGVARDMPSAFAAMKQGCAGSATGARAVPVIVFHGDRDTTVNPRNGDAVAAQAARASTLRYRTEEGRVPGGHAWRRTLQFDAEGRTVVEQWLIRGAGHAWSGGSPAGSFTDPRGPDASGEMLRFFLEHPRTLADLAI